MEVKIGLRVVRGPDWEGGDQDGGEGFVGTVVAGATTDGAVDDRHCVATVQWDIGGERLQYRCGVDGKYDLRVLDSGAADVVHHLIGCTVCGIASIAGCVWRCLHCLRYHLCTPCYMQNKHSVWHHFIRIDTPDNPNQRTRVECRYLSHCVPARGVFPGATVIRGHDWRWGDQDGGPGRVGIVQEIEGWHSESSRSVTVVEWKREVQRKRKYRVGHKGKVDLQCTVPGEGGSCYLEHLPLLGSEYIAPTTHFMCAGDRAMLEMDLDLLKSSQDEIGGWDDNIVDFLGKVGLLNKVNVDETEAVYTFPVRGTTFHVVIPALKKVDGPHILSDDVIRVIDDMAEVHRIQKEGRGWDDDMALTLGRLGRVGVSVEDGFAVVVVDGKRWLLDPRCLVPARGEQPEDELSEAEILPGFDMLWITLFTDKEPSPDILAGVALRGCAKVLDDLLTKWPDRVNAKHNEKTLLHVTAAEGRLNATKVLLKHKADITATNFPLPQDKNDEIPLHNVAYFNHYHVAKLLLDEGSDVNARGHLGNTPLHVAAAMGFSRLLGLLLNHPKCDINAQDHYGDTALHFACRGFWGSTTKMLLEAGADTTLLNLQAANPLLHAVVKGFYYGVELYMQYNPAIINESKIDDGYAPLHVAAHAAHCDELCYLAAMNTCELDQKTYIDQTALHIASRDGNIQCLECLVGYGADVKATDALRNTPLHFVLGKRNMKPLSKWTLHLNKVHDEVSSADNCIQNVPVYVTVACFLASEGADLEIESLEGLTPLRLCPPDYLSLLKLFARPERRGHYRGSLPRHSPPVPISIKPQVKKEPEASSVVTTLLDQKTTATDSKTTPIDQKTTPTDSKATPTKVHISGVNYNKSGEDSDLNTTSSINTSQVTGSCFLCEGPCDICFQPCGHTAMCAVCAKHVKRCPTCRNSVSQKIKITV